jgi:hypothetical protein
MVAAAGRYARVAMTKSIALYAGTEWVRIGRGEQGGFSKGLSWKMG